MDESTLITIRFTPPAADDALLPDELTLLESILPELIHAMMQAEADSETE